MSWLKAGLVVLVCVSNSSRLIGMEEQLVQTKPEILKIGKILENICSIIIDLDCLKIDKKFSQEFKTQQILKEAPYKMISLVRDHALQNESLFQILLSFLNASKEEMQKKLEENLNEIKIMEQGVFVSEQNTEELSLQFDSFKDKIKVMQKDLFQKYPSENFIETMLSKGMDYFAKCVMDKAGTHPMETEEMRHLKNDREASRNAWVGSWSDEQKKESIVFKEETNIDIKKTILLFDNFMKKLNKEKSEKGQQKDEQIVNKNPNQ